MNSFNRPYVNFQNQLLEKIRRLIPPQDRPVRLVNKDMSKEFCYSIANIFAGAGLVKKYMLQYYVFNGIVYESLDIDGLKHFIYNTVYQGGIILSEKECMMIVKEIFIQTPEYMGNQSLNHPITDMFLDSISGGDPVLIKRHWEVIGYCISSDAMAKRIFTLVGESGDNEKSTYLSFLCSLISYQGVMQMSITNLVKGWFSLSELSRKRVEISADEGILNLSTAQIATLKSISGHDWIAADVKHKQQVRFLSTCKILIASNHNIGAAYTACDSAFARRICSLPFDVKIPKEQQDPYLAYKLDAERNSVVTEAFCHYLDLRNRNYVFTGDDIYDNNLNFYPNNPTYNVINDFNNKYCCFCPEAYTYTEELYTAFVRIYGNTIFKNITSFSQAFYRVNSDRITKVKKHTTNRNAWGFSGVSLKGELI